MILGTKSSFGTQTTRLRTYALKTRPGVQLEMVSCNPPRNGVIQTCGGPKIVLEFTNEESIDTLITKLRYLKTLL